MNRFSFALVTLLRWSVRLLPASRRDWGEAVHTEAALAPPGWERAVWVSGGLWTVARQMSTVRRLGASLVAVAVGTVIAWLDWHPGSANPAMPANRISVITITLLLASLPWLARLLLGPVADNRVARTVRVSGYLAVYALLAVLTGLSRFASSRFDHFQAFDQNNWEADMRAQAVAGAAIYISVFAAYAVAVLALTSHRAAAHPATMKAGVLAGGGLAGFLYALMPLGNPLQPQDTWVANGYLLALVLAPLVALLVAVPIALRRDTRDLDDTQRTATGAAVGFYAGATTAVLLATFTILTMLLLPRQVDLKWDNPNPNVPHGTTYEVQMSVGDAAIKYQIGLVVLPLLGLLLGAISGAVSPAGKSRPATGSPSGSGPVPGADYAGVSKAPTS